MLGRRFNKAAFSSEMHCPFCSRHVDPTASRIGFETEKTRIKCLENVGPFVRRYQCGKCGGIWRYDIATQTINPYSSFKRGLKLQGLNYRGFVPLLKKT
jgi:hypothetical protein